MKPNKGWTWKRVAEPGNRIDRTGLWVFKFEVRSLNSPNLGGNLIHDIVMHTPRSHKDHKLPCGCAEDVSNKEDKFVCGCGATYYLSEIIEFPYFVCYDCKAYLKRNNVKNALEELCQ